MFPPSPLTTSAPKHSIYATMAKPQDDSTPEKGPFQPWGTNTGPSLPPTINDLGPSRLDGNQAQLTQQSGPPLIEGSPLDGNNARLMQQTVPPPIAGEPLTAPNPSIGISLAEESPRAAPQPDNHGGRSGAGRKFVVLKSGRVYDDFLGKFPAANPEFSLPSPRSSLHFTAVEIIA